MAVQLLMILQTILAWFHDQCLSAAAPGPDLGMVLGRHKMTDDERYFVKNALLRRALENVGGLLKRVMSRVEHVDASRRGNSQSPGHGTSGFWNLQQLVRSLAQSFGASSKRLAAGHAGSWQRGEYPMTA